MYDNEKSENYSQNHEEIPNVPKMKKKKNEENKNRKKPTLYGVYRIIDHAKSCELIVWCPHTISLRAKACSGLRCFD